MELKSYKVRSGSLDVTVKARNHKMAVFKAIEENNPKSLGLIIGCLRYGDSKDEELYTQTESTLKEMGFDVSFEKENVEEINLKVKEETKKYKDFLNKYGHSMLVKETYDTSTEQVSEMNIQIKFKIR